MRALEGALYGQARSGFPDDLADRVDVRSAARNHCASLAYFWLRASGNFSRTNHVVLCSGRRREELSELYMRTDAKALLQGFASFAAHQPVGW